MTLAEKDEFVNANPLFVDLMILDNSVPRMKVGRQRFGCFHEVTGAWKRTSTNVSSAANCRWRSPRRQRASCCGWEWSPRRRSRTALQFGENCGVLARDLLETLLAGLPAVPFQRRESDLESALPEASA